MRLSLLNTLLIFFVSAEGQSLVANGSFEDRNKCMEYGLSCGPEAWFYYPLKYVTFKKNESNFEEIHVIESGDEVFSQNYVYTKFLCPLKRDVPYVFSIWIKASKAVFNHLNVWVGKFEPGSGNEEANISEPAFSINDENRDSTDGFWSRYNYLYTAKGDESFMLLGNIVQKPLNNDLSSKKQCVYYIDNVQLLPKVNTEICPEYYAVKKQLYDQDNRHTEKLVNSIPLNDSLVSRIRKPKITGDKSEDEKIRVNDTIVVPNVFFDFNTSRLNSSYYSKLEKLIGGMKKINFREILIIGHTDNIGSNIYNIGLSLQRAKTLKKFILRRLALVSEKIKVEGVGKSQPVSDNSTVEGRTKNRRVEIILKH